MNSETPPTISAVSEPWWLLFWSSLLLLLLFALHHLLSTVILPMLFNTLSVTLRTLFTRLTMGTTTQPFLGQESTILTKILSFLEPISRTMCHFWRHISVLQTQHIYKSLTLQLSILFTTNLKPLIVKNHKWKYHVHSPKQISTIVVPIPITQFSM